MATVGIDLRVGVRAAAKVEAADAPLLAEVARLSERIDQLMNHNLAHPAEAVLESIAGQVQ